MDVKDLIFKVATSAADQALKILGLEEGNDAVLREKIQSVSKDERVVDDLTKSVGVLPADKQDDWLKNYKKYMDFSVDYEGIDKADANAMFQVHQKAKASAQDLFERENVLVNEVWMSKKDAANAAATPVMGKPESAPGEVQSNPTPPAAPGEDPGLPELGTPSGSKTASIKVKAEGEVPDQSDEVVNDLQDVLTSMDALKVSNPAMDTDSIRIKVQNAIDSLKGGSKVEGHVISADTKQNKGEVSGFPTNDGAKQGKPGVFPKTEGMVVSEKGGDESISTKKDNTIKFQHEKAGKFDAEVEKVARSRGVTCENIKMASVVTADLKQNQKAGEVTGGSDNAGAKQGKPGVFPKVDGMVSTEKGGDANISTKKDNTMKSDSKAKALDAEIEKVSRARGATTEKGKIV